LLTQQGSFLQGLAGYFEGLGTMEIVEPGTKYSKYQRIE